MAEYHISADWVKDIAFDANIGEHTVRMDSGAPEGTNTGPSPKRMVLAALIVCTGMDVVSLLYKMRVSFTSFRVEAIAPITPDHPKTFERVDLKYILTGKDIDRTKVVKAVNLSQERYCGISIMIKKHCPIEWELEIRESSFA
jgi:putative redox protein